MADELSDQARRIWREASEASWRDEYELALSIIQSGDQRLRAQHSWRLFEIQQLGLLQKWTETLAKAEALIGILLLRQHPSPQDLYFLAFAQWFGQVAHRKLHPKLSWPTTLDPGLSSVVLDDVEHRWKSAFPLTIHPNWSEDCKRRASEAGD